ncbi:hypothetical protein [Methylocucumis oryzae]|uniref:hypothetical protein n=1 Tax=Methylocucumis oryzae TaxID=1632867 RepID=UPI0012FE8A45|nr:hypothetical protein [Methylocucumis oryzae]
MRVKAIDEATPMIINCANKLIVVYNKTCINNANTHHALIALSYRESILNVSVINGFY